uniref:Alcohol dehydrogenase-like 7 n=1 Tax=Ananas comosus var. bracteatus TaxID=296719 RepID=A0A6V7Q4L2_ANACO|nr:unnamed protein product [Ananas comosus var. bracteatus]
MEKPQKRLLSDLHPISMENKIPKPIRCKAAVCRGPGEALLIEEVVVAPPEDHEVRIKILCTSLCHSDLTFWRMKVRFPGIFPRIFGHEAVGVVESVGGHVEGLEAGDMVVPTFLGQCDATADACVDCRSERSNMCSKLPFTVTPGMPRSHGRAASRFTDAAGRPVHHFLNVSSFSEYTVVDAAHVVRVDPTVPPEKACLLSCGASTGVGAAGKVAGVEAGSTVAIFGLGAVGLAPIDDAVGVVFMDSRVHSRNWFRCENSRASRIIGVDLNPDKFELGKKFGLTDFINPKELGDRSISEVIIEMTNGGADYCFECIGLASVMKDAFQSSRQGWGKTIILGVEMHGAPLCVAAGEILWGKCIMGSLFGGIKPKIDIPIFVKQYLNKELQLDEFITHEIGFEDINKAFDLLVEGKSLRCTIWMDK